MLTVRGPRAMLPSTKVAVGLAHIICGPDSFLINAGIRDEETGIQEIPGIDYDADPDRTTKTSDFE